METSRLVRPEEAGPVISVRHPRGSPPVAASISGTPLRTIRERAGLPLEVAAEHRFELFLEAAAAPIIFAFYSPVLYFYRMEAGAVDRHLRFDRA